jgi:hypothetical protein
MKRLLKLGDGSVKVNEDGSFLLDEKDKNT